jgi:peptidoglycan hydrolase FlgJ
VSVSSLPGGAPFPLSIPQGGKPGSALTAPVTPGKRVAVIDKSQVDPETLKAAQGMEAMFIDYMLKVMRQTVPKQEMDLESPATGIYRSMQDSEYAQRAARAGGVGLADQIVAYLDSQRYTLPRGHGVPARAPTADAPKENSVTGNAGAARGDGTQPSVTGGTREGRSVHE